MPRTDSGYRGGLAFALGFLWMTAAGDGRAASLQDCAAIAADPTRLACYDALAGRPHVAARGAAAVPASPSPSSVPAEAPAPRRHRVEVTGGYGIGSHSGEIDLAEAEGISRGVLGGRGFEAGIGYWRERVWGSQLSLGVEYVYTRDTSSYKAVASGGIGNLTNPVHGKAEAVLNAHTLFLNVGYMPPPDEGFAPFAAAGLGLGVGTVDIDAQARVQNLPGTLEIFSEQYLAASPALRLRTGITGDIGQMYYWTLYGALTYYPGLSLELGHDFVQAGTGVGLGLRF